MNYFGGVEVSNMGKHVIQKVFLILYPHAAEGRWTANSWQYLNL
jgi:hypothetical protein